MIHLGPTQHLPPGAPPLKAHPFANLFPMMTDAEYNAHRDDIGRTGINHPIVLHRGAILDGRNRYRAALELNIGIATQVFAGSDREALDLVCSENIHRRHLTTEQRALIAARMAEIRLGGNQHTAGKPASIEAPSLPLMNAPAFAGAGAAGPKRTSWPAGHTVTMTREASFCPDGTDNVGTCACGEKFKYPVDMHAQMDAAVEAHWREHDGAAQVDLRGAPTKAAPNITENITTGAIAPPPRPIEPPKPLISQSDAAAIMGVSRSSVQRAAIVIEKGVPELADAVAAGTVAASAAADIAQLPLERQREIIAQADPKAVKAVAKEQRSAKREASREKKLDKMRAPTAAPLLTGQRYGVIYIDIPRDWKAWSDKTGMEKSPETHYATAPFDWLADLPIRELAAENCALVMYAWQPSLIDQIELMAEWGFAKLRPRNFEGRLVRENLGKVGKTLPPVGEGEYRSHMVWGKRSGAGGWHRGTGFWWINCHELLLLGVRGDVPCPLEGTQEMSIIDTVVGEHSAKPDAIRAMIDRYFPGVPKLEMFARVYDDAGNRLIDETKWPDWRFWGAEALSPDPEKQVSQDQARYRAGGQGGPRHCGSCRNRSGAHACRKVVGAIGAGMTCNLWAGVETVHYAPGPPAELPSLDAVAAEDREIEAAEAAQ